MSDVRYQDDDPNMLSRLFDAASGFVRAPDYSLQGRYAPQTATPGTLTEEDAYRQNYSRDREVLDALQMGWYGPRGGSAAINTAIDYAPSRLTKGAERDAPRKSIFDNASGIFPDFDKAAPKSGLQRLLSNFLGTPARREERRSRAPQAMGPIDPETGERFQFWPERLVRSAATLGGDVARGGVPAGPALLSARRGDYTDIPGDQEPADMLMERAQDLAGVLGGGPLTAPRGTATLASGAKRPPNIGEAGMTRRGLFDAFRSKEAPVAERPALDIPVEGTTAPNLPAVQDPLARLLGGGEAPRSNLLDQLTAPPAAQVPSANMLSKVAQVPVDRRELLRGAGAVAANASRVGKVAEALMKPTEVAAAPQAALPKFEEIWKRGNTEQPEYHHRAYDRALEAADEEFIPRFEEEHPEFKGWSRKNLSQKKQEKYDDAYEKYTEKHFEEYDELQSNHLAENEDPFGTENGPRYSDYQLPGGENYRELLIKHPNLPDAMVKKIGAGEHLGDLSGAEGVLQKNVIKEIEQFYKKSGYVDHQGKRYSNVDDFLASPQGKQDFADILERHAGQGRFHSSTWDEPNVLGHLRMHDRDIPGVGRSTHLEELNSEWHQEGKQKGYKHPGRRYTVDDEPYVNGQYGMREATDAGSGLAGMFPSKEHAQAAINSMVPHAPLKDTWPDYLLRRTIKEAVDNNHDAVSWTPGKHQLPRHDMTPEEYPHSAATRGVMDFYDKHLVDRANEIGKQYGTKVEQRKGYTAQQEGQFKDLNPTLPVLRITPQLRKAVKDGSFSLLSDSGKPGAPLSALEKAYGSVDRLRQQLGVRAGTPEGRAVEGHRLTEQALKAIDDALKVGTSGVPRVSLPGVKRQNMTTDEVMKAIDEAIKSGKQLYTDSGKPGAALAALEHTPQPHFYSAVERAVGDAKLTKATPEQWLGYLRNQPGVRQEELQHLGIKGLKGKSLTKAEMLKHVNDNGVKLEETWKKEGTYEHQDDLINAQEQAVEDAFHRQLPPHLRGMGPGHREYDHAYEHFAESNAAHQIRDEINMEHNANNLTKFSEYQLPGGDNYRELLMRMKARNPLTVEGPVAGRHRLVHQETGEMLSHHGTREAAEEARRSLYDMWGQGVAERNGEVYRSSHWDEPNVLGHVRMNDRMIPDAPEGVTRVNGKPVMTGGPLKSLHLEELQSDWHQTGRKQGYKGRPIPEPVKDAKGNWRVNFEDGRTTNNWDTREEAMEMARKMGADSSPSVPDAPFKQTWPDLLLKRSLREAVENGYDAVSWTPGDHQSTNPAKHVDSVDIKGEGNNQHITLNGQHGVIGSALVDPSGKVVQGYDAFRGGVGRNLTDYVGKDMAEKILKANDGKLEGEQLKVGNYGMRAFYNKMLVDKANALGKKYGAKVEWKGIGGQGKYTLQEKSGARGRYEVIDSTGNVVSHLGDLSKEDARKYVDSKNNAVSHKIPVLKLTPEFKAAIKRGFPLFASALPFGALDDGVKRK